MAAVIIKPAPRPRTHRLRAFWRRAPLSFRIGAFILFVHLIVAVTGPFWAPYGFAQMGAGIPLSGMSWAHPFGIDQLSRDIFSRVVHGSHIVILLSLSGTALGLVIGATCRQGNGEHHTQRAVQPRGASVGCDWFRDGPRSASRNQPCEKGPGRSAASPRNRETLGRVMATRCQRRTESGRRLLRSSKHQCRVHKP